MTTVLSEKRSKLDVDIATGCGCVQTAEAERRRAERYACRDAAELRVLPEGASCGVVVLDISRGGLRIQMDSELWKGCEVEITVPQQAVIFGQVRHCERASGVYHVGVLIQDVVCSPALAACHVPDERPWAESAGGATGILGMLCHVLTCPSCSLPEASEM